MLSPRNLYLTGTALLTAAAAIEGGTTSALLAAGIGLMIYAFFVSLAD